VDQLVGEPVAEEAIFGVAAVGEWKHRDGRPGPSNGARRIDALARSDQRDDEFIDRRKPVGGVSREGTHERLLHVRCQRGLDVRWRGIARGLVQEQRGRGEPGEGGRAGEHLVQHAGQCILVGAAVDRLGEGLFGAHVHRGPHAESCLRDGRCGGVILLDRAGNAKVGDERVTGVEKDVLGLDVTMHYAATVRPCECVANLARDRKRIGGGQRAGGVAGIEHGEDVRVLQPRRDVDLAPEAFRAHRVADIRAQDLQRDRPPVAQVTGAKHHRHAANAGRAFNGVAISQCTRDTMGKLFQRRDPQ